MSAPGPNFITSTNPTVVRLFIALEAAGCVGLTLITCIALFSPRVHRSKWWISLCGSWAFSSLCYILLSLAGQQNDSNPTHALCLTQAALCYAAPPLTASTIVSIMVQLWSTVSSITKGIGAQKSTSWRALCLLTFPYVIWVIMFAEALIVGLKYPETVTVSVESGMFCGIQNEIPRRTTSAFVILTVIVTLTFEVLTFVLIYRNRSSVSSAGTVRKIYPLPMIIRTAIFSLFGTLSVGVGAFFLSDSGDAMGISNLFLAALPIVVFLLYGFQKDVIFALMFWKKSSSFVSITGSCPRNGHSTSAV